MKPMTCDEVRQAIHGRWVRRGTEKAIHGVSTDSRTSRAGELFIALRGEKFDGHQYLPQAGAAGCAAAVVASDFTPPAELANFFPCGLIAVANTETALGELGAHYRRHVPAHVVAVTGSNGKTTVKRMIHHVLSKRLTGSCSPKSFNNQIGVPLTLLGVGAADDYVVCELGSNAPGEIAGLARMCRPDVAVITSVGPTHLEKLGSIDGVAAEKASILVSLSPDGLAVVRGDCPQLEICLKVYGHKTIRFGQGADCQLRLTGFEPAGEGIRFQINGRQWVDLPAPGRHNAFNAMAAMAVAQRFGFAPEQAGAALADFEGTDMRLQAVEAGSVTVLNDAYNANPASVMAAADVLADRAAKRKVMIVGDMRELGPQSRDLHLQTGRQIAQRGVDLLIGVGELGRYIAQGAATAGAAVEAFDSVEAAASGVAKLLRPGDVVLVKGSRAMAMERLVAPIQAAFGAAGGKIV